MLPLRHWAKISMASARFLALSSMYSINCRALRSFSIAGVTSFFPPPDCAKQNRIVPRLCNISLSLSPATGTPCIWFGKDCWGRCESGVFCKTTDIFPFLPARLYTLIYISGQPNSCLDSNKKVTPLGSPAPCPSDRAFCLPGLRFSRSSSF